jgi:hypothetical protein
VLVQRDFGSELIDLLPIKGQEEINPHSPDDALISTTLTPIQI